MTIIDNTIPYSPILEWKPKPKFRTTYERDKYWSLEKKKWIEGIGEIPGTLYHKTQEQKIKDRDLGSIFRPICRDADLLVHHFIRDCRKDEEAALIVKGRGFGLSSEGGCLANYFMSVFPGTTSLLTSSDKPKIASLFSEKVAVVYDNYDEEIKAVEIRRNETATSCYLKIEKAYKDEQNIIQTNTSQIICRETSDSESSASAFSGQGAMFGFYDELYLNKRRKKLIESSASCYMNQRTRTMTGFLLGGGTCEHTLTNEQLAELKLLIQEVQTNGRLGTMKARLLFLPSWMGTFMTNGHSDEKKGMEWWQKEIEALEKLKDPSAVRAFRMNNPMSLDDIFELNKGGRFEDDISDKIKQQHKTVVSLNIPIQRCKLVNIGGAVKQELDFKNGHTHILESPKSGVEYYLCIDGVATGNKTGDLKGSNVAGTIVKTFDTIDPYSPIAIYSKRPDMIEQSYYDLDALARYYNQFGGLKGIMAEANAGTADHYSTFLEKQGMSHLIMNRQDLSGKGNSNTNKLFQYVTIDVRDFQMKQANMFLRKYIGNIKMILLLEDMMKANSENADILDSWLMFFTTPAGRNYDKPAKISAPPMKHITYKFARDASGKTIVIEVKK